ncbi:diguanylate cyclase [Marinobacter lacisalsi]|uniref:diguanylate cyclase n=1 Tax=Marinobacter lacisalsi TaxID=475979 RepID=A0ABV8QE81_9GAMM
MPLPTDAHHVLDGNVQYLEDSDNTYTAAQVRASKSLDWQTAGTEAFNQGVSDSTWWLRLQLVNTSDQAHERLLEIGYPLLDHVNVYVYDGIQQRASYQLGDKQPYLQRPLEHHHYLVPLTWQPEQTLTILVRVESSGAVWAPLTLWTHEAFVGQDGIRAIARGLFYGALAIFVVYNLMLFLSVRERSYLYYVCSYTCLLLFSATFTGLSFRYIWSTATTWNELAVPVFLAGISTFGNLLACELLRLRQEHSPLARIFQIGAIAGALIILAAFVVPYQWALTLSMVFGIASFAIAFIIGLHRLPRGGITERLFTVALAFAFISSLPNTLAAADLMSLNAISKQSMYHGTIIAALLLSFALASRITDDRRLRHLAHQEAMLTTQRAKAELEERVLERTREQQRLSEHLQELSITDAMTGASNRRYFEQRLAEEWKRCGESERSLAVILMDADHFKRINDTYGHAAGDACLIDIIQRSRRCLRRPADVFARFGGEEFCVLLPETDQNGALTIAERIRLAIAESPVKYDGELIPVTVSAGVASTVPSPGTRPDRLLNLADKALYDAKETGRNRVCARRLDNSSPDHGSSQ